MDKEDGSIFLKIGDGETNVNDLPDILTKKTNPPFTPKVNDKNVLVFNI